MSAYESRMQAGNAAMAAGDPARAAQCYFDALQNAGDDFRKVPAWIETRCAFARAAFLAFGPAALPAPYTELGNVVTMLDLTLFGFKGDPRTADLGVGRTFMELANIASVTAEAKGGIAEMYYQRAQDRLFKAGSAQQELAHAVYQFESYRAYPGVIDNLERACELLKPYDTGTPTEARGESPDAFSTRLKARWQALLGRISRIYGRESDEMVNCLIAAGRHFERYEIDAPSLLPHALDILRRHPELDAGGRRVKFLEARL